MTESNYDYEDVGNCKICNEDTNHGEDICRNCQEQEAIDNCDDPNDWGRY